MVRDLAMLHIADEGAGRFSSCLWPSVALGFAVHCRLYTHAHGWNCTVVLTVVTWTMSADELNVLLRRGQPVSGPDFKHRGVDDGGQEPRHSDRYRL